MKRKFKISLFKDNEVLPVSFSIAATQSQQYFFYYIAISFLSLNYRIMMLSFSDL